MASQTIIEPQRTSPRPRLVASSGSSSSSQEASDAQSQPQTQTMTMVSADPATIICTPPNPIITTTTNSNVNINTINRGVPPPFDVKGVSQWLQAQFETFALEKAAWSDERAHLVQQIKTLESRYETQCEVSKHLALRLQALNQPIPQGLLADTYPTPSTNTLHIHSPDVLVQYLREVGYGSITWIGSVPSQNPQRPPSPVQQQQQQAQAQPQPQLQAQPTEVTSTLPLQSSPKKQPVMPSIIREGTSISLVAHQLDDHKAMHQLKRSNTQPDPRALAPSLPRDSPPRSPVITHLMVEDNSIAPTPSPSSHVKWFHSSTLTHGLGTCRCLLLHPNSQLFYAARDDGTLQMWSLSNFAEPCYVFRGHRGPVVNLALSVKNNILLSGSADTTIVLNTIPPPTIRAYSSTGNVHKYRISSVTCHTDIVWSLCALPSSFFSASADKTVRHWDLNKLSQLQTYQYRPEESQEFCTPTCVTIRAGSDSPNSVIVCYSEGLLGTFDIESAKCVLAMKSGEEYSNISFNKVSPVPALGSEAFLVSSTDSNLRLYDISSGKKQSQWNIGTATTVSLDSSETSTLLCCGYDDGCARIWDLRNMVSPLSSIFPPEKSWSRMGSGVTALAFNSTSEGSVVLCAHADMSISVHQPTPPQPQPSLVMPPHRHSQKQPASPHHVTKPRQS
ncbi:striatin 1/3/4 [Pelomyxa schiedti]|nr:striatin 1/3/4 [Pelomyxa schiedti]